MIIGVNNKIKLCGRTKPNRGAKDTTIEAVNQTRVILGILLYHCPRSFVADILESQKKYGNEVQFEVQQMRRESLRNLTQ